MTAGTACLVAWIAWLSATAPYGARAGRREPGTTGQVRRARLPSVLAAVVGRRREEQRRRTRTAELAAAIDLLAVGLSVGLTVRDSIAALARHGGDVVSCGMGSVVGAVRAGATLDDALGEWAASFGRPADQLVPVLVAADRRGVAVVTTLERLAVDLRRRRRRDAEAAARRLTVRMLVPLVGCILPAFGLVVVAPMVVVGLGDAFAAV